MTLKTSSRKINPFFNMVGFTVRKSIGIIIVLSILALLYCPGRYIKDFEANSYAYQNNFYSMNLIDGFANFVVFFAGVLAVGFNIINFGFLYKKSSSDVFHAFPLTRTELLLSRTAAGLLSALIPVMLCYIGYGFMAAFYSWMGSIIQLLYYLFITILIMLLCSAFSLVFFVSAGSMFDFGVSFVGANVALIVVAYIFNNILSQTLLGYNGNAFSEIVYFISPIYLCAGGIGNANNIENGIKGGHIFFLVIAIVYTVAFTLFSICLYNKRKAEKSGTAYAYKFMYLFCSLLAGICGGYLLGMLFDSDIGTPSFWIFFIIGALLTATVYGTVTNRGFKGISKSLVMGTLSIIITAIVTVVGVTGGLGYEKRIPETDEIKSVTISVFGEDITFKNPEQIIALHSKIVNNKEKGSDIQRVNIVYNLKGNKHLTRQYRVDYNLALNEFLAIYQSDERLETIKNNLSIANISTRSITFYSLETDKYYTTELSEEEFNEFINAYWLDVKSSTTDILTDNISSSGVYYSNNCYELVCYSAAKDMSVSYMLSQHESFTNTANFIETHNIIERSETNY